MSGAGRLATLLVVMAAGCHHHRDTNAPGRIDPMVPPAMIGREELEYPGDPGERMVMLTTGVVGGAFGGTIERGAAVMDLAAEATVSWGESERTHNDRESRLFMPSSVLLLPRSRGITLGWSGLRVVSDDSRTEVKRGPLYVEVQRTWLFAGLGAGWAFDPSTLATGPQVNAFYTFYYLRGRWLFGDGWELGGGLQIKIPNTWVWSR